MKNNNIKKLISSVLTLVIIAASLMVGWVAFGEEDLTPINASTFSDANWRKIVAEEYDRNGDGFLSVTERNRVTIVSLSGLLEDICGENAVIENLAGIELFPNIQRLYVGSIGLKTLDVSSLKNLTQLTCQGNSLTVLRIGSNPKLVWINCASNELVSLNVSGCPSLTRLDCQENKIESLNLAANSSLQELFCQYNELTSLDVSNNSMLSTLYCANNHLTSLDLSENLFLSDILQFMIGNQTVSARAILSGSTIVIPFQLDASRVLSTSLDTFVEGSGDASELSTILGYSSTGNFVTTDANLLHIEGVDGDNVEYTYDVKNANVPNMNVYVGVTRDFYQVNFYTDESMTELMKKQFVPAGGDATAPRLPDAPEGKIFNGWSDSFTSVTEDKNVYMRWVNPHVWSVTRVHAGSITLSCSDCSDKQVVKMSDVLNITDDDILYLDILDAVPDGIINAKDYAKLNYDINIAPAE